MRLKGVHMWRCFILTDAVNDLLEYKNCDRYPALYFVLFLKWLCFKFYWIEAAPRWKWIYIYHVLLWGRSSRVHAELCAQLNSLDEATSGYICSHYIHDCGWFFLLHVTVRRSIVRVNGCTEHKCCECSYVMMCRSMQVFCCLRKWLSLQ